MGPDLRPAPAVTATITPTGVLTVWGLSTDPLVVDEGAPTAARNALINLLQQHAQALGAPVCAAARTPAGPWYISVHPTGQTVPHDPAAFAGVDLPALDPHFALAGAEAVFAAAQDSPPAAMLALASDPDPAIRATALARLAGWPDDPTPVADAQLPPPRLELLAGCALGWVRAGVVANPGTDPGTLAGMVNDPDPLVRLALAARFDLAPDLTVQLTADPDPRVRTELARNPAASFLAAHPAEEPRAAATAPVTMAPPAPTGDPTPTRTDPDLPVSPAPADRPAAVDVLDPAAAAQAPTGDRDRSPHRALRVAGATLGVVVLAGGGYAAVSTLTTPAPTASTTADESTTVPWNGMSLPTGPDGPSDPAGAVAEGFAHTELGAAMAAAHLSVRIDPYAGPASFEPTITTQTHGGDPRALLAATHDRYTALDGDGGPIPTTTGQITGWRIDGWTPDTPTTVHLRVAGPAGAATDYGIAVVWVDGDYALVDPTRDDTFTTRPAEHPTSYRSF